MTENYSTTFVKSTAAKCIIEHRKVVVMGMRKGKAVIVSCDFENTENDWSIEALSTTDCKSWYAVKLQEAICAVLDAVDEMENPELMGKY